jgi:hypothetical protein
MLIEPSPQVKDSMQRNMGTDISNIQFGYYPKTMNDAEMLVSELTLNN